MSDRTKAVALEMAERHLKKMGWKFGPRELGKTAAEIINEMNSEIRQQTTEEHGCDG